MATKDFLTITPDSGSGNGSISVVASANEGEARSTTINISGSGITKTVSASQEQGVADLDGKQFAWRCGKCVYAGHTKQNGLLVTLNVEGCQMSALNDTLIGFEAIESINLEDTLGAMKRVGYSSSIDTNLTKAQGAWDYKMSNATVKAGIEGAGKVMFLASLIQQIMFESEKGYTFMHTLNGDIAGMTIGGYSYFGQTSYSRGIPLLNTAYSPSEIQYLVFAFPTISSYTKLIQLSINGETINVYGTLQQNGSNSKACTVDYSMGNSIMAALQKTPLGSQGLVNLVFQEGQESFMVTRSYQ